MDNLPRIPHMVMPCTTFVKLDERMDGVALQISQCPVPGCLGWGNTLRNGNCYHRKRSACPVEKHMARKRQAPFENPHHTPQFTAHHANPHPTPILPAPELPGLHAPGLDAPGLHPPGLQAPEQLHQLPVPPSAVPPQIQMAPVALWQQMLWTPAMIQLLLQLAQSQEAANQENHKAPQEEATNNDLIDREIKQEPI
ncbi:unnamed protein product [Caenorhabditis nigoni]